MIIQKQTRDVIKEIASEFNLSFEDTREIVYSQFEFLKERLQSGVKGEFNTFDNILLKYLGTFYISKGKFKYVTKYSKDKKNG